VPVREARKALVIDYANMLADAAMVGAAMPFNELMQPCKETEIQVNMTSEK
jgi:hypothetical protein